MKLKRTLKVLVIGVFAAAIAAAQTADDLYQKALTKERAEGRYGEAIALYRQVLKQSPKDRGVAAKALLHIGQCLEKQGNAEARKTYEQLVREYPEQQDLVQQAKAHVAALGGGRAVSGGGMRSRQLWATDEDTGEGSISPDGRLLYFPDWSTGDLGVRDLASGEMRKLTHKGTWQQSADFAEVSRVSNSGRQVAYAWFVKDRGYELRVMKADGTNVRTIYRTDIGYVEPLAWSPDDSEIFALTTTKKGLASGVAIPATGGTARVIVPEGATRIAGASYSPDGKWIAFGAPGNARTNDIFLASRDGASRVPIVAHPANDTCPIWSADGKRLYFVSNRMGDFGLWALQMDGARPIGSPELVKGGLGARRVGTFGIARDGALLYTTLTGMQDVSVARLEARSGKVSDPVRISDRTPGANRTPAYSPDGRSLAYVTAQPSRGDEHILVTIRDVSSGNERQIEVDRAAPYLATLSWHSSGSSLVLQFRDVGDKNGIVVVDSKSGHATVLREIGGVRNPMNPAFSPDGKTLYRIHRPWPDGKFAILADDITSGATREVYSTPVGIRSMALSRDGSTLAFWAVGNSQDRADLLTIPVSGGQPTTVISLVASNPAVTAGIAFSPDSRWIYYVVADGSAASAPNRLVRVRTAGGQQEDTGISAPQLSNPSIHPDGDRIAFSAGARTEEVWALENFAPAASRASK